MRTLLLLASAFGLIGGVSLGFCQVAIKPAPYKAPPSLDSIEIHQLFFERVARSNPRNPFTFQSDLSDGEMAIVNNVAANCDSKLGPLSDQPVRWEALMRSLESGEEQEVWLNQRLTDLKARRKRVVLDHVEALRVSLGEPRFQALETSIQDWYISLHGPLNRQ
ncbi:MAG TPA: hypothetical protein VKE70_27855 [Candidatus Solibacter sp.]|nr:hypothetical protein [Candidatus Solibacter sp.]